MSEFNRSCKREDICEQKILCQVALYSRVSGRPSGEGGAVLGDKLVDIITVIVNIAVVKHCVNVVVECCVRRVPCSVDG